MWCTYSVMYFKCFLYTHIYLYMYLDCIINSNKDSIPPPSGFCWPPLVFVTCVTCGGLVLTDPEKKLNLSLRHWPTQIQTDLLKHWPPCCVYVAPKSSRISFISMCMFPYFNHFILYNPRWHYNVHDILIFF